MIRPVLLLTLPWPRRIAAMVGAVLTLGAWDGSHGAMPRWASLACAILLNWGNMGAQLAVRAFLGLALVAGILERGGHGLAVVAAGGALLALGSAGLEERSGSRFVPLSFRGPLLASLVVALMQIGLLVQLAQSHAVHRAILLASGPRYDWHPHRAAFEIVCAAAIGLGVLGLYRLRVWGLLLHLATGVGFGILGALQQTRVAGVILLPLEQTHSLGGVTTSEGAALALAVIQVALVLPLLVACARSLRSTQILTR